jgi:cell division protein FtsL
MDNKTSNTVVNKKSESLIWLIIMTILIAVILVVVSFAIFLKSGAYDTVRQIIIASNTLAEDDLKGYDVRSPIQADDLRQYGKTLDIRIKTLNDNEDFNQQSISDNALGI